MAAHRIVDDLYAVGTYDLGVYLIATARGHILINSGAQGSTGLIKTNIGSLGFRLEDVEVLLTMQAHWDHTAALAEVKRLTGPGCWLRAPTPGSSRTGA